MNVGKFRLVLYIYIYIYIVYLVYFQMTSIGSKQKNAFIKNSFKLTKFKIVEMIERIPQLILFLHNKYKITR